MEIGKYYKVYDKGNNFWMIGRVETVGGLDETDGYYRGKATYMSSHSQFDRNPHQWSYGSRQGHKGRTYQDATQEEINWLNYCI
jgi:hypothetical protein